LAVSAPPPQGEPGASATQIILKTDERSIHLEPEREGKFAAKSSDWHENRFFFGPDKLEVAVKNGRWGLTHLLAAPRSAIEPVRRYFPGD
jgi:hypothetical protein